LGILSNKNKLYIIRSRSLLQCVRIKEELKKRKELLNDDFEAITLNSAENAFFISFRNRLLIAKFTFNKEEENVYLDFIF
jgi:hypothetical protein